MKKIMKSGLSLVLAITIIFSSAIVGFSEIDFGSLFAVKTQAASTSDLTLTLSSDGTYYSVTDCNIFASGRLTIPSTYNGKPVKSIESYAFRECTGLTSITIPDSVTTIGSYAFDFCKSLTSITIPDSVTTIGSYAFYFCESLTTITIPDSVTTIGSYAFENCISLTSINIPNSVTTIDSYTFRGCTSLTSITIPDSVTTILNYAFSECTRLTSITIPDSVTTIGSYTFYGCTSLTKITIPNSVTTIGSDAFENCISLTSITIPDSVTSISSYAFENCISLTTITIPDSVTTIGSDAFYNCKSLTSITIPDSVTSIGAYAFYNCKSLTSITIPNSVTSIGNATFMGCESLESITLPFVGSSRTDNNSDSAVFGYIFGCFTSSSLNYSSATYQYYNSGYTYPYYYYYIPSSLKTVIITDTTQIPYRAFYNCSNLTSITIPDSVTSINNYAFYNCSALSTVYYDGNINQKNNISIGSDNSSLTNAIWHIKCTTSDKHTYSTDFDNKCNVCGYVRVVESVTKTYGVFTYCINPDENRGAITITDVSGTATGAVSVPSEIGGYKVVCIGSNAFENCTNITSITIPNSVTTIGSFAFQNCSNLTSITIPNAVTTIGSYTFYGCTSLTKITIPNSVTSINNYAFYNCSALSTVYYDGNINQKNNISIGSYNSPLTNATWYCLKCTTSDKHTYSTDFDNKCNVCEYVRVVESVTKTYGVFTYCINPDENRGTITITDVSETATGAVSVPSEIGGYEVVCIGSNAFENCTSITSVTIPNSVTSISSYAFENCISLTTITIPDRVTSIGEAAFKGCTSLESITLPFVGSSRTASNTYDAVFGYIFGYTSSNYSGTTYQYYKSSYGYYYYIPSSLKTVIITDTTQIPYGAFYNCANLTSITIPNSVTTIDSYAFYYCESLTTITIPDSVTSIGEAAFGGCTSLESITLPFVGSSRTAGNTYDAVLGYIFGYSSSSFNGATSQYYSSFSSYYYYYNIPTSLKTVIITDTTQIPYGAFYNCANLTSITILNSVTTIGRSAFYNCNNLTSITIPNSVTRINNSAFYNCNNLTSITIPNSVTSISSYAFENCISLTSINIPDSVTSIGEGAFYKCSALSTVYYDGNINQKNNISIGSYNSCLTNAIWHIKCTTSDKHTYSTDFDNKCNVCEYVRVVESATKTYGVFTCCINPDENRGTITITDVSETAMGAISVPSEISGYKVVCIGSNAFENCTSITSITIPNTVKSIESYAFYGCSRLTSLTIPDSVEAMGNYMLSGCTGLLELKLPFIDRKFSYLFGENQYEISNDYVPRSLKQITISSGDIAGSSFSGCNNISVITLGDKVTSIGDSAFYACNSITKVTIGNAVKTIGASAFQDCVSLTQVTIGKSVENIGTAAFKNCKSLLKVSIPNSTTKIKDSAFENCYNLATLTLGSKVDQIGNYSFRNCWRLTGVAIPDSTTLIGSGAFQDCSSLEKVTFGKNVTTIFDYAFEGCSELENIILPSSATSIGEYAFSNCSSLKRATIRGRTNHINNGTFEGCSSLVTVAFPKNVTTIAYNAFNCCYSLKEVWYEGSKADKNQILVAAGNSYIQDANWYYSSFDTVTHKYSTVCDEECDICGEIRTVNNHESDAGTVTKNATYTATGIKVYKCTVCGEVLETEVIPQLKPATPKLSKVENTASGVKVTWGKVSGADSYIVYRKTYNAKTKAWSGWTNLGKTTSTSYVDKAAKSGTYYLYTVRANNEAGLSGYNTSGIKTYFLSTPKLSSTANTNSAITVKWGKVTGASGYVVYRKTTSGWTKIATVKGNGTVTYTDKSVKAGVTYKYTVRAYYGSYLSSFDANGLAIRRLATPKLTKVVSAKNGITFTWGKVTGATGYVVYRKTGKGSWQKIATVKGVSTVKYLDKTAKKGTTYTYTVRAYYGTSNSAYNTKGLSIKDKY